MVRALVFDGDDTLWETEHLYDEARAQARKIVEGTGLDGAAWEAKERLLDVENVARFGHGPDRFPTSCVEAYEAICKSAGELPAGDVGRELDSTARSVFEQPAPLVPEARETLGALREMGVRLALLTKGDPEVQLRRVEQSGLRDMFELVEIVEQKTPEAILAVLSYLEVAPAEALTVGNSVRSDVLPSLVAGVKPIWIDAHVWEYEREHKSFPTQSVIEGKELGELVELVSHEDL